VRTAGADAQAPQRIAFGRIQAQRHHQARGETPDPLDRLVAGGQRQARPALPRGRQVQAVALAGALAPLVGVAPEKGIETIRIGVQRNCQHLARRIEDALRAIAVMHIDVEDGHPRMPAQQPARRNGRVVQEAEAAGHVGIRVVAGGRHSA
jgi:hypothetical protein